MTSGYWERAMPGRCYVEAPKDPRPVLGVGMLGYGFMGKAHSNALPSHPFMNLWWPAGHLLGWEHAHINMFCHFLRCVGEDHAVEPDGASFYDGFRAALISEAMSSAAVTGRRVDTSVLKAA